MSLRLLLIIVGILSLGLLATCSVSTVSSGHVGIKVSNWGNDAGVSKTPLPVGWHMTAPGVNIYEYPVYTSPYTWGYKEAANPEQGRGGEAMDFQDASGLILNADVAISYRVNPALAPKLFQTYRQEMALVVSGPVRNKVRSILNENSSKMNVEDIMGKGKALLIEETKQDVKRYFASQGLEIEDVQWASSIRLPKSVKDQIDAKIAEEQKALKAAARVATVKAEADAAREEARGKADAMAIEANAIAQNPQILELRRIERWDGKYPTTMVGGGTPLIQVK